MEIQWYKSDKKSKSIIAYGFLTEKVQDLKPDALPQEAETQRRYKIEFLPPHYVSYQKRGKKYLMLDNHASLEEAKKQCLKDLRMRGQNGK